MSIHELAVRFAAYLAQELGSDYRQEQRMAYGLEILLGEAIKMTVIIVLSWLLGILAEVLAVTVTAGILRLASGGEHCSEYYRCLIGGTAWFLLLGWGVQSLNGLWSTEMINLGAALLYMVSALIIIKYAPGETENKPIKSLEERYKYRFWSLVTVIIYAAIMLVLAIFAHPLLLAIGVGMLAQAYTVSPAGYSFIHFIDRVLNFSEVKT